MKHDHPNTVIDEVLSEEETLQVLSAVENSHGNKFVEVHCQTNNFINLPQNIIDKFTGYARSISKNNNLVLTEYCHSKYENREVEGHKYKPSLFPHYDETFKEERFTVDFQLKSNVQWPLVVEEKEFTLFDNQALTFSGTNQIHWRTPKPFGDNDFVEMIYFHFSDPTGGPKEENANQIMDSKSAKYQKWFDENGGYSNGKYLDGKYING